MANHEHAAHPLPRLIKELRDETFTLVRQEIALARKEMGEKAVKTARNAIAIAAGGLVAIMGLFFMLWAASMGITLGLLYAGVNPNMAVWLGPLILGVVVALIGYAFIQKGLKTLRHEGLVPNKTVHSLQENTQWMKAKLT